MKLIEEYLNGYEKEYYRKYKTGIPWNWAGIKPEEREGIYKLALEEGKTWQEITGYKNQDDVIL